MINWTAFKKDDKVTEHRTGRTKVIFTILGIEHPATIVEYYKDDRAWVQIDGSEGHHLVNKSCLIFVNGEEE